jgi:hypothetical protein
MSRRAWRHRGSEAWRKAGLLLAVVTALGGCPKITRPANPDLLDNVTGTEGWRRTPENISQEWKDWYRARVAWRREHREVRVQRVRNVRLADLIERFPDGPGIDEVQAILRSRATRVPRGLASAPEPATPAPTMPEMALDGTESAEPAPPPRRPGRPPKGGAASRDRGREPPAWVRVPVERLDEKGQAIDEEGEHEMDKVFKKRKR